MTSYWGMYIAQSVIHSIIAFAVAEGAILSWNIQSPQYKQGFRLAVIFLSIFSYPVYQYLSPDRGDLYFRLTSLFDSNRWFFMEKWGSFPMLLIFLCMLSVTAVIFMIQELAPIISNIIDRARSTHHLDQGEEDPEIDRKAAEAMEGLPFDIGMLEIMDDDDLMLFSSTGLKPMIYVSTGLIRSFSVDHLHVAFAHEVAHILRSRRPVLIFAYLLRVLQFFNPIAMIEFRRLAHEEEKVCDDMAIELTGKPDALTEAIEMLRPSPEDYEPESGRSGAERLVTSLEYHSHDMLLKSRAARIGIMKEDNGYRGMPVIVAAVLIICINYFVV